MRAIAALIIAALMLAACASDKQEADLGELKEFDHGYPLYTALLAKHVLDGRVSYAALTKDRADLDKLIEDIAVADLSEVTQQKKLSFYINAHNLLVMRTVVDHYPVKSIQDIDGALDKTKWPVAGEMMTLESLYGDVIRGQFAEPRVLLALNRAALGDPPLQNMPFFGRMLDGQLQLIAEQYVRSPKAVTIDPAAGTAHFPAIFELYGSDFIPGYKVIDIFPGAGEKERSMLHFIYKHLPEETRQDIAGQNYDITYADFDWSLNDRR